MKRRAFIVGLAGAAAWPPHAHAQQSSKVWLIGFLGPAPAIASALRVEALRTGLRELGYVEGKNVVIEFRWAEGAAQMRELAAELVRLNVDVIFATSSTEVEAARQATRTIPIVFATHADPVGVGHVESLPRPGGNATGLSVVQTDLTAKALEVLRGGRSARRAVRRALQFGRALLGSYAASSPECCRTAESDARSHPRASRRGFRGSSCAPRAGWRGRSFRCGVVFDGSLCAGSSGGTRAQAAAADYVRFAGQCRGRRPHELCARPT